MSYLSKKHVLNSIKHRNISYKGKDYPIYEAYFGTDPYSKKPVRKTANSIEKIKKIIDDFFKKLSTGGDTAVLLSAYQSMDARNAIDLLLQNGIQMSLTECARFFIENKESSVQCSITLGDAYNNYINAQEGKSEVHIKAIKMRIGKWVEIFGGDRLLSEVTAQELSKYLEEQVLKPNDSKSKTTFNGRLNYIQTFYNWCAAPEQAFINKIPIASMKTKKKEWTDPEFLSAKDTKKLFDVLELHKEESPEDLADAILSFFCGMRQAEIKRVRLGSDAVRISIENRNIRVVKCKGSSKGVRPRSFTIPNTALAWMQSFDFMSAVKIENEKFREHLKKRAMEAGIELPQNAGRHTFITMHAAAFHDQNLLTNIAGNTDDVRSDHYDGLTFEDEGKSYFDILPTGSLGSV